MQNAQSDYADLKRKYDSMEKDLKGVMEQLDAEKKQRQTNEEAAKQVILMQKVRQEVVDAVDVRLDMKTDSWNVALEEHKKTYLKALEEHKETCLKALEEQRTENEKRDAERK